MATDDELARYREYLRLLARRGIPEGLRGKLDASDVVQQTLWEAHRRWEQFAGSENERLAWLRAILEHNLTDAARGLRRQKRDVAREQSLDATLRHHAQSLERWLVADLSSPSSQVRLEEQLLQLADALARLPEAQQTALLAHYCDGQGISAIAKQMERSPAAVAGLLKRGLRALRNILLPNPLSNPEE